MKLIEVQTMAARVACEQMTGPALKAVRDNVQRASSLPARPGWEHKATAHAKMRGHSELAGYIHQGARVVEGRPAW